MQKIDILSKDKCTGCSACRNVCPKNAIDMVKDEHGFSVPVINSSCIDCGLCAKTCPALTAQPHLQQKSSSYAVWAQKEIREQSGSGGVFACLAERIIDSGGVVYGAAFDEGCRTLRHIGVSTQEELPRLYKSKYLQSEIGTVLSEVKENLSKKIPVLFSGTPCQVEGLRSYLKKDYDNLYTVDILCHGVPSPMAYERFLDEIAKGQTVTAVDFRDKKYGWGKLLKVTMADGSVHYDAHNGNYLRAFADGLSMRESCMSCPYARAERVGDITLGDFWGVASYKQDWDDKRGTSLVLCNSSKGRKLFNSVIMSFERSESIPIETTMEISRKANGALVRPIYEPEMRKCFLNHLAKGDSFSKALRYAEKSIMDIGLLGWWIETPYSNYGSTLTNYALYRYLSDEGYSVAFVSPANFDRKYAGQFNYKHGYRMTAKYSMEQMSENNKYIDTFIVGSDVLWYYDAFIKSGYSFLLDFVDDSKKKISYSTSFGNTQRFFPKEEMPKARRLMKKFDHVAVREFEGVDICKKRFGIEGTQVLDPVFLTDGVHWKNMANSAQRKTEGKFMFAYMLDPTPEKVAQLKMLAEKKQLKLVSITDKQFKPEEKTEILRDCGVIESASIDEFIYHISNAEFVVTDSYHGFCFSLIFRRNYLVLVNRTRGGSRFDTLAELFGVGVSKRFAEQVSEIMGNEELHVDVDYSQLSARIEEETARCRKWLINAIEAKKVEHEPDEADLLYEQVETLEKRVAELERIIQAMRQAFK